MVHSKLVAEMNKPEAARSWLVHWGAAEAHLTDRMLCHEGKVVRVHLWSSDDKWAVVDSDGLIWWVEGVNLYLATAQDLLRE